MRGVFRAALKDGLGTPYSVANSQTHTCKPYLEKDVRDHVPVALLLGKRALRPLRQPLAASMGRSEMIPFRNSQCRFTWPGSLSR